MGVVKNKILLLRPLWLFFFKPASVKESKINLTALVWALYHNVIVLNPTCLVCRDVNRAIGWWLVAQVGHCIHGQDAEGVVGVSHQINYCHPGLRQAILTGNESNGCSARTLHHPPSPSANACAGLPSNSASWLRVTVLTGSSFPRAFLTQHAVQQVAATPSIKRAIPLQIHRRPVDWRDDVNRSRRRT